jgi:hypothetical protein
MDLTEAMELFEELKRRIDDHGDYLRESEYRTRILLVDPLLRLLGWNVEDFHCVEIEFRTAQSVNERADYVLKNGESKIAIVEAKKLGAPMRPKERRQAKEYADYADASQCVLTDGARWLLYDLNQGRNPDTMQPWVEFDIENDVPEQLVLRCLALWQSRFTSEVSSSPDGNILAGSTVARELPDGPPTGGGALDEGEGSKPKKGKKPQTRLVVTMSNGEEVAHHNAKDTFVEVIEKLGIDRVRGVFPELNMNAQTNTQTKKTNP